jgi:hypothetical protein
MSCVPPHDTSVRAAVNSAVIVNQHGGVMVSGYRDGWSISPVDMINVKDPVVFPEMVNAHEVAKIAADR